MSTKHSKAAAEFLKNKKQAAWHDETLWLVRAKRDRLSKEVPEWEELRDMACATKLYSNSHLDELLVEFEKTNRLKQCSFSRSPCLLGEGCGRVLQYCLQYSEPARGKAFYKEQIHVGRRMRTQPVSGKQRY